MTVMPAAQGDQNSAQQREIHSYKQDPPLFVLKVRKTDKGTSGFNFFDEQLANRVAKAMVHAVELCGGGRKPEPF
jgi:hypothetical protein